MVKNLRRGRMVLLGLALLGLLLALWRVFSKTKNPPTKANISANASEIFNTLLDAGFTARFAAIVTSQAAFETGGFTSELFIKQNNAFGMMNASGRPNTQLQVLNGFGVYESIEDSARDFVYYWKAANLPQFSSVSEYVDAIKAKGYFTAPVSQYAAGVTRYFNELFPNG